MADPRTAPPSPAPSGGGGFNPLSLIAPGIGGVFQYAGAKRQAKAMEEASRQQTQSARYASDAQERSQREEREHLERQAAEDARRYEIDRRANYDIANAHEQRLGTLSQMFGFGPRQGMPAYVPGLPGGGPAAPAQDLSAAQAKFNELFPDATLTPEMIKAKEADLTAAGFTLRPNAAGVVGKVQYGTGPIIDVIQGAGSGLNRKQWLLPQASGAGAPIGSLRDMAMAQAMLPPDSRPGLTPSSPYIAPSTLRDYARRR